MDCVPHCISHLELFVGQFQIQIQDFFLLGDFFRNLDRKDGFADIAHGGDDGVFIGNYQPVEPRVRIRSGLGLFHPGVGHFDIEKAIFIGFILTSFNLALYFFNYTHHPSPFSAFIFFSAWFSKSRTTPFAVSGVSSRNDFLTIS